MSATSRMKRPKAQPTPEDWRRGARVKPAGETLRLDASRAAEFGVASHVVDSFDELKQLTGSTAISALPSRIGRSSSSKRSRLPRSAFCCSWSVLWASTSSYIARGRAGGFVAAVAFLLFFWSHFLDGTAEWLEVLLFLGGIFCLLWNCWYSRGSACLVSAAAR